MPLENSPINSIFNKTPRSATIFWINRNRTYMELPPVTGPISLFRRMLRYPQGWTLAEGVVFCWTGWKANSYNNDLAGQMLAKIPGTIECRDILFCCSVPGIKVFRYHRGDALPPVRLRKCKWLRNFQAFRSFLSLLWAVREYQTSGAI